jgi:hypothetical protein
MQSANAADPSSDRMAAMNLIGTVLPLVGVALGTLGTLTGQYLATRGAARRYADERAAALRAERKAAILSFLDKAQHVEQLLDARDRGRAEPETEAESRMHEVWLAKKVVELTCRNDTASIAHRYTSILNQRVWRPSEGQTAVQRDHRAEFMEAARRELGIEEPRLYAPRRTEVIERLPAPEEPAQS